MQRNITNLLKQAMNIYALHTSTSSSAMAETAQRMLQWATLRLNIRLKGYVSR